MAWPRGQPKAWGPQEDVGWHAAPPSAITGTLILILITMKACRFGPTDSHLCHSASSICFRRVLMHATHAGDKAEPVVVAVPVGPADDGQPASPPESSSGGAEAMAWPVPGGLGRMMLCSTTRWLSLASDSCHVSFALR